MMKNKHAILLFTFLCLINNIALAKKLDILTTIRPLYGLVHGVSGDKNYIHVLIEQNQSPHSYNVKPSDIRKIHSANITFMVDDSFEFSLASYLEKNPLIHEVVKFSLNPQIALLRNRQEIDLQELTHTDQSNHSHHHDQFDYDMHFWLDPNIAQIMVKQIANKLGELDPENANYYWNNALQYNATLQKLDLKIKAMFLRSNKPFIVFHDAYQYFSNHYNLENVGVVMINHNITPGVRTLQKLQEIIKTRNAKCIFAEPQFSSNVIKKIADTTNIKVGIIDSEYGDVNIRDKNIFLDILESIANNMLECFNQSN